VTVRPAGASARTLTRTDARRIAIRAQLLSASRPTDLQALVSHLTFLQLDPTSVLAPSADLVAWSRLGDTYRPEDLQQAVEHDRLLFEHRSQPTPVESLTAVVRPMSDLDLFLADMLAYRESGSGARLQWMAANTDFRQRVLDLLRERGPLASRDIPDTASVSWQSTGWTNDRNVTQMLEFLASGGMVAVAARRGRQRLWDLAERVYPTGVTAIPAEEAHRQRAERWLRSMGIARPRFVGDAGVPVRIEGTSGEWRVDPDATAEGFVGRTALLSPFDRLIHNRPRTLDIFAFDYVLELYKPKATRRWGFYALPILHQDRLIGKLAAAADRHTGVLRVEAIHEDEPFAPEVMESVEAEVQSLARWLHLDGVAFP
jgi:uncharacterized protein YcaQ